MSKETIRIYLARYPQLSLPVADGMSNDPRYQNIVRRGILPEGELPNPFTGTDEDAQLTLETPAGPVEELYLAYRRDFERFIQVISGRCEPISIPKTTGAITFFHLTNWHKILERRAAYEADGGIDWPAEFARFTADRANYQDTLVLVSNGPNSGLPAARAGFGEKEWLEISRKIRIYHEATHVVCGRRWPQHKEPIRDEVLADCIGLLGATGRYDAALASRLLGVEGNAYTPGGRLENYAHPGETLAEAAQRAKRIVAACRAVCLAHPELAPFALLSRLEDNEVGMQKSSAPTPQ